MAGTGCVIVLVEVIRDAGANAQQDALQQRCLWIGYQSGNCVAAEVLHGKHCRPKRVPQARFDPDDLRAINDGMDALPAQVILVGKVLKLGRRLQQACHAQQVPVPVFGEAGGADQDGALDGVCFAVYLDRSALEPQVRPGIAPIWIRLHDPLNDDPATLLVMGHCARIVQMGNGGLVAECTQE